MIYIRAIIVTVFFLLLGVYGLAIGVDLFTPIIILSSLWAGWDSFSLGMYNHKTGLPKNPIGVALAVGFLWIIGLPWYLVARFRLQAAAVRGPVR